MTSLVLDSKQIVVQTERERYNKIRRKYQALATNAAVQFTDTYATNFTSIDDIHEKCTDVAMRLLLPAAEEAIRDLVSEGIFDIDIGEFEEYFAPHFTWNDDFAVVDDRYMAIVLKAEEADAYRTQRRQNRSKWVGGGFGIEGAIKGAAKAGALNIASGALHGTFNVVAKGISAAGDAMKKSALFADPAVEQTLTDAVYRVVFNTHFVLLAVLVDKKPGYVPGNVPADDEEKAARLLENVRAGRIPATSDKDVLIEALTLHPYNPAIYRHWLQTYGDRNGELEAIEAFFGINVSQETKLALFNARSAALDLSSLASCEAGLTELGAYAASIGFQGYAKEKERIVEVARQMDRERRTVDGKEYPTLEAANRQRESVRAAIVEKDNTLTSTGKDTGRIVGAVLFMLFAVAMLMDPSRKMFVWAAIPLGLSVACLQAVRSLRAMKLARGIGYVLAGLGALIAVVDAASAAFANGSLGVTDFLVIAIFVGLGWGIQQIMRKLSEEAGYPQPKSLLIHSAIAGAILGGTLFAAGSIYQKSQGSQVPTPAMPSPTPATQAAVPPQLPTIAAPTSPPDASTVFSDLYSVNAAGDKVTLASKEEASIWHASMIETDAGPRFVVLVARTTPEKTSASDAAPIDAVSYRSQDGRWQVDSKVKGLFSVGTFGIAASPTKEGTAKPESHLLKPGMTGLFLPSSSSEQGYGSDYLDVVGVSNGAMTYLGRLEVGGENSGACDGSAKGGLTACYGWKGQIQVQTGQADQPNGILIAKTGTEIADTQIGPAKAVLYVWSTGKGYQLQK